MTIYSGLLGTGGYLPETILTNEEISRTVETTNEWIVERTGIKQRLGRTRRIAKKHHRHVEDAARHHEVGLGVVVTEGQACTPIHSRGECAQNGGQAAIDTRKGIEGGHRLVL